MSEDRTQEERDGGRNGLKRWGKRAIAGLVLFAAGAACAWAAITVMRPADDPLEDVTATFVKIEEGSVSQSLALNATAEWTMAPIGVNRASGVVTSVTAQAGAEVTAGAVLYEVDLRPVIIAAGEVPAFREISSDTAGADVAQLQRFLAETGFYSGAADGRAGLGTIAAIRAWQVKHGMAATGIIGSGDIIFVPILPTRIALDDKLVARGASLSGGEEVLQGLPTAPSFRIPVTESQAAMVPTGAKVQVTSPGGEVWEAVATDQKVDRDSGTVRISLDGPDSGAVCGAACDQIPVTGQSSLKSQIVLIEAVRGLVVPSAALITGATGQIAVIDTSGNNHPVKVVASAKGMSVITGVDAGLSVRVPAQDRGTK